MDKRRMIKVYEGLELCEIGSGDRCYETECPYYGQGCTESLKNDILALLKERENKKLIDADKLREKLGFAECCEDCKRDSWKCGKDSYFSLTDFCMMLDIAIEELMQEGR